MLLSPELDLELFVGWGVFSERSSVLEVSSAFSDLLLGLAGVTIGLDSIGGATGLNGAGLKTAVEVKVGVGFGLGFLLDGLSFAFPAPIGGAIVEMGGIEDTGASITGEARWACLSISACTSSKTFS